MASLLYYASPFSTRTLKSAASRLAYLFNHYGEETPKSPLLTLPAELRLQIYELLLVKDTPISPCVGIDAILPEQSGLSPQLLRTCKQVYSEASSVLYGQNTLSFDFTRLYSYYAMWSWTSRIRPETFANIRKVKLNLKTTAVEVPCKIKGSTWEERNHFSAKPHFWLWRRNSIPMEGEQDPPNFVDVYTGSVELEVDFSKGMAAYTEVKVWDGLDCCMDRSCYPDFDLTLEANAGKIHNFPSHYEISPKPTVKHFGELVGRFTQGHECVGTPGFFSRLTSGKVLWCDLENDEWRRWRKILVELKVVTGMEVPVTRSVREEEERASREEDVYRPRVYFLAP